ncbi:MAG: alpha/beta hydrolase [Spirochaetes bacterium]|nr:MAG: alpha/beta hydrolase [Spirochaetota bacterium]
MKITVNGIKCSYSIYGTGKPVIAIHGYGIDHRVMKGCMEPVFKGLPKNLQQESQENASKILSGWQRIYFDLPGMGTSTGADKIKNADGMLEFVIGFINKVVGDKNFLVIGYSYGGYLARAISFIVPERIEKLFLLCPVVIPDKRLRTLPEHTEIMKDEEFLSELNRKESEDFRKTFVIQTRRTWERYSKEIFPAIANVDSGFIRRYYREGYAFSFDKYREGKYFDNYKGKTVILTGKQDSIVGYTDVFPLIKHYPRATFTVLDGAGHNLQIEQEDEFNHIFRRFLFSSKQSPGS